MVAFMRKMEFLKVRKSRKLSKRIDYLTLRTMRDKYVVDAKHIDHILNDYYEPFGKEKKGDDKKSH